MRENDPRAKTLAGQKEAKSEMETNARVVWRGADGVMRHRDFAYRMDASRYARLMASVRREVDIIIDKEAK